MKKYLIALLLSLSCACAMAAAGCGGSKGSDNETNGSDITSEEGSSEGGSGENQNAKTIVFEEGEGYTLVSDFVSGESVEYGTEVTFKLNVSAFYTGNAIVYANEKAVAPRADGSYTVVADQDLTITVTGLKKDVSRMDGMGTKDSPFLVSKPIDLLFIAEKVNAGEYRYVTASYMVVNNIDCKGEELQVIGDLRTENSYFAGCFLTNYDPVSGKPFEYKISNFTIHSESANYVGLFGAAYKDASVENSALFHGIQLENFTINAGMNESYSESKTISVGSLLGYGVGATIYLCSATNGEINVLADNSYFAFAGGLIGYQQGFYAAELGGAHPSEVAFSNTDVDIRILSGMALAAGGISGYMVTNYPLGAPATIHHSYAHGNVSGALYSGGVAGSLGQYTVITNSYATGEVVAKASQAVTDPLATTTDYCYSYAGGIAGFAENDSIVSECFFDGSTAAYAASGAAYATTGDFVGGGNEKGYVSVYSEKYSVQSCVTNPNLADETYFMDNLSWLSGDWVFKAGKYPTINFEPDYERNEEGEIIYDQDGNAQIKHVTLAIELRYVTKNEQGETESVKLGGENVKSLTYFDNADESLSMYASFGEYLFNGGLVRYLQADNGYLSYGYFFDEACTQKVPYSYTPMKNVTLYVGFADPTPVLGTYQVMVPNHTNPLTITLDKNGFATYSDGKSSQQANYSFDGETVIIESARLSRFYLGEIIIDEKEAETDTSKVYDANFDLYRYSYYNYRAELTDEGLAIYDGLYYTEESPLYAMKNVFRGEYFAKDGDATVYYSFYGDRAIVEKVENGESVRTEYDVCTLAGTVLTLKDSNGVLNDLVIDTAALSSYDNFKGSWTKTATVDKTFTFDGINQFTYTHKSYVRDGYTCDEQVVESFSGEYSVLGNGISFTMNGVSYVAEFNASGALQIVGADKTQTFYRSESYVGSWSNSGIVLNLLGIGESGIGKATAVYSDGSSLDLVYEASETENYVCLYLPHDVYVKNDLFGYFTHDVITNTLTAYLSDTNSESGFTAISLFVQDDYNGEWICNAPEFTNVEFDFNGFGLYGHLPYVGMEGTITLIENGKRTVVPYTLDAALQGKFAYNGKLYLMSYDEDAKVVILNSADSFERKDAFANIDFIDISGNSYAFDGKSALTIGGKFTINGSTAYGYKPNGDAYDVYNLETKETIGSLVKAQNVYSLTIGEETVSLYIRNAFMGTWAISGEFATFTVGPTDINGIIHATFKGVPVEMTYYDVDMLTFQYKEGNNPYEYYLYIRNDLEGSPMLLSQNPDGFSGYQVCAKADELFGTWVYNTNRNGRTVTLSFDGITSPYAQGVAKLTSTFATAVNETNYYYMIKENGILMWSQEADGTGKTSYYKITFTDDLEASTAFVNGDKAILRTEVDGLYLTEAKMDGKTYLFDGGYKDPINDTAAATPGKLLLDGEAVYTYLIKSYNANRTATLELCEIATGKKYSATLDYADSANVTLTLGDEIVAA